MNLKKRKDKHDKIKTSHAANMARSKGYFSENTKTNLSDYRLS